uniref:(northern house mosquito) hypothetical protein n=1 Tax=Culex pipiens TaxID=7175 RepID=A0A8D8E301_CULPI
MEDFQKPLPQQLHLQLDQPRDNPKISDRVQNLHKVLIVRVHNLPPMFCLQRRCHNLIQQTDQIDSRRAPVTSVIGQHRSSGWLKTQAMPLEVSVVQHVVSGSFGIWREDLRKLGF